MTSSAQLARHFREVHFGGNWTASNLKDTLADVTWEQAITPVYGLNTIATLTFHIGYFVEVALKVLQGGPLEGDDEFSFDHPPIHSDIDWQSQLEKTWVNANAFADLVEKLPEEKLWESFEREKYGNYYRNILGIIEHSHYHLGQIALIKKILNEQGKT